VGACPGASERRANNPEKRRKTTKHTEENC